MNKQQKTEGMLSPYRVLDLADEKGSYCGKILADLGADVIKIEKPGGDPVRNIGSFYHDIPDPEKSLNWFAFNRGKRGITLNIETADGRDIFNRLAKSADFVIESFAPGYMDSLGLGYLALSQINPRIIMVSITPFGQTGPYKDYKASDIIIMAMNGFMFMCGDPDRPPVQVGVPQACLHAGVEAAIGALMAHWHRKLTGEGQYIDVSAQECGFIVAMEVGPAWHFSKTILGRAGHRRQTITGLRYRIVWPCKDGSVVYFLQGGPAARRMTEALVVQMDSEGMAPDWLKQINWDEYNPVRQNQEEYDRLTSPILEYFKTHTQAELYEIAIKIKVPIMPMNSAKEILKDDQLAGRRYWVEIEHPELETSITYPGAFIKASETPLAIWRRAPLIGEHNDEVYEKELGLSSQKVLTLKECGII